MEQIAYFWEQADAEAVAARLHGVVRRGRSHGEDDDEDHPWIVLLTDADQTALEDLLTEYDGWLETTVDESAPAPPPLPSTPKRFKNL